MAVSTGQPFELTPGQGAIQFYTEPPILTLNRYQRHLLEVHYDDELVLRCVGDPIQGTGMRLRSVNDILYTQITGITELESKPISEFWSDYMVDAGIPTALGYFDDYMTTNFILESLKPLEFIRDFSELFSGYAYEQKDGKVGFRSHQSLVGREVPVTVQDHIDPIFNLTLTGQVGSVFTQVTGDVATASTDVAEIATVDLDNLFPLEPRQYTVRAEAGQIVRKWEIKTEDDDETQVIYNILSQTGTEFSFTATNIGSNIKNETAVISGEFSTALTTQVTASINLAAEALYGTRSTTVKPWSADGAPVNKLLALHTAPATVMQLEFPIETHNRTLLYADCGILCNITSGDYQGVLILGRRGLNLGNYARLTWELFDLGRAQLREWTFGNHAILLGVNSFLANDGGEVSTFWAINGRKLAVNDRRLIS